MFSVRVKIVAIALVTGAVLPMLAQADGPDMSRVDDSKMSCQSLMDQAKPVMEKMSDPTQKMKAQKELDSAQSNLAKGKMKTCKYHVHKAMGALGMVNETPPAPAGVPAVGAH